MVRCTEPLQNGRQVQSPVCMRPSRTTHPLFQPHINPNSTLIVRLISTAQTGFFYTTQRVRTGPKLAAVKYDPRGMCVCSMDVPCLGPGFPVALRLSFSFIQPFQSFRALPLEWPLIAPCPTSIPFFFRGGQRAEGMHRGGARVPFPVSLPT